MPHPRPVKRGGGEVHPRTQSFHTFQILNSRVKIMKKISLLFFQTKKILYVDQSHMTEARIKNLFRMQVHPHQVGNQGEIKQLFLNAKSRRLEFGLSKIPFLVFCFFFGFNLLYSLHRRFVKFSPFD